MPEMTHLKLSAPLRELLLPSRFTLNTHAMHSNEFVACILRVNRVFLMAKFPSKFQGSKSGWGKLPKFPHSPVVDAPMRHTALQFLVWLGGKKCNDVTMGFCWQICTLPALFCSSTSWARRWLPWCSSAAYTRQVRWDVSRSASGPIKRAQFPDRPVHFGTTLD